MNMKNWKNFFRVHGHSAGGFTLVELIVVIAILAILAGVAIPAYSGYIKKAQNAGDLQLLDAINSAFTAACLSENIDMATLTSGTAKVPLNPDMSVAAAVVQPAAVRQSFGVFFAGNENAKFTSFSGLTYDAEKCAFKAAEAGDSFSIAYGGGVITLNPDAIDALKDTTFFKSMGTEGLLEKVSDVSAFAALLGDDSAMQKVYQSDEFIEHAASAMGIDTSKEESVWMAELESEMNRMIDEMRAKDPDLTWDAAYNQLTANAAVIHASKNASEMNPDNVLTLLTGDNATAAIQGKLSTDSSAALSEAALAYGMYTAYAHSTGDADLIASTEDPLNILRNLDDPGFKDYLATEQAKTDLDGYMAALGMINDTSKDPDAVSSVLVNGFNNEELVSALGGAFGG